MRLAERLLGVGIAVALDDWSLAGREVSRDRNPGAWSEALLISRAAFDDRWQAELARRLLGGAVAGRRRLVPVLLEALEELPAALRSRPCVEAHADPSFASGEELWRLVALLRGERGDSSPPSDWPAGAAPTESVRSRVLIDLRLAADRFVATVNGHEIEHVFERAEAALLDSVAHADGVESGALASALLAGALGERVRREIREATASTAGVEVTLEVAHRPWQPFEWESVLGRALAITTAERLPAEPGVLPIARVQPSRAMALPRAAPAPLEVLVVIASPESRHGAGSRVDAERASRAALAALQPACTTGRVRVTLRERAVSSETLASIGERAPHVVMLVAAMRQGELAVARADDREERVAASRWVAEALGGANAVPLVIVAHAPLKEAPPAPRDAALEAARVGYELLAAGLPAVLALADLEAQAELVSGLLVELSGPRGGTARDAMARARAAQGSEKMSSHAGGSLPAALLVTTPLVRPVLASTDAAAVPVAAHRAPPRFGVVGRRDELRAWRKAPSSGDRPGLWITGQEGVGKTTFALALAERGDEVPRLTATLTGRVVPEDVVEAVGSRLAERMRDSYERDDPEADGREPLAVLAAHLCRADVPWRERWDRLARETAGRLGITVVLDGFEDNLEEGGTIADSSLRELFEAWPREAGAPRALVVSRRAPSEDDARHARLETLVLEPLGFDAASWMRLCSEHLVQLGAPLAARVASVARGLPRRLRLLERVLAAGGVGALDEVLGSDDARLEDACVARLVEALASPLARALVRRASVHRVAVDELGLAWLVGRERDVDEDPASAERLARFDEAIRAARARGEEPSAESLGLTRADQLVLERDIAARVRPPLDPPEGFAVALGELVYAGFVEPSGEGEKRRYLVPRWLRGVLAAALDPGDRLAAHACAARYRHWRVRTLPRPARADLADGIELRHHLVAAGALEQAVRAAEVVVSHLDALGALERAERLCHEVLAQLPPDSGAGSAFRHQLGICARRRGRIREARAVFHEAAVAEETRGERAALARSWGELGVLAALDGDVAGAEGWFERSLALAVELGDRDVEATNLHHLGVLARHRGDEQTAASRIERALAIREERASDPELVGVLLSLGALERARHRFDAAQVALTRALLLARALGDERRAHRASIGLARTAMERDQPEEAARHLEAALAAAVARGDRVQVSEAAAELGRLAELRGDADEAWRSFRRALEAAERDGDREGMIAAYLDLARLDRRRGHAIDAQGWAVHAVAAALTVGSARTTEALDALTELASSAGSRKRWRSSWKRAYDVDPPAEVIAWVEAPWWRRVARRRELRARAEARS